MTDFLEYLDRFRQLTHELKVTVITTEDNGVFTFSFANCPKDRFKEYDEVFTKVFTYMVEYISSELKRNCCIKPEEEELFAKMIRETLILNGGRIINRALASTEYLVNDIIAFSLSIRSQLELCWLGYKTGSSKEADQYILDHNSQENKQNIA